MSATKKPPVKIKKKYNTKPTLRQKELVKILVENGRKTGNKKKITMGKALKKAGYSKAVQVAPTKVTESKSFKQLLKEMIPDDDVVKLQKDLMYAARLDSRNVNDDLTNKQITDLVESVAGCTVKKILRPKNKGEAIVYFWTPDNNTRKSALDMFYKLNNSYPKDKDESDTNQAVKSYLDKLAKILP